MQDTQRALALLHKAHPVPQTGEDLLPGPRGRSPAIRTRPTKQRPVRPLGRICSQIAIYIASYQQPQEQSHE